MCDMCDKYLAPRFTPHLVKYVMPVYTFASRERICGENDLGESAGWWCSKNPVNTGCKFLKCGKHGTKFSRRCFTHLGGEVKPPFIPHLGPLMMRSARQRREAQRLQGRHGPTVPKNKSDVKLETFEDFREGENLKSRQLLVSFILSVLARGESKPCRSSTLSRDLFTLTD